VTLTSHDIQRIIWLLNPEVKCVIGMRAVFAACFLLPGMKMVNNNFHGMMHFILRERERERERERTD